MKTLTFDPKTRADLIAAGYKKIPRAGNYLINTDGIVYKVTDGTLKKISISNKKRATFWIYRNCRKSYARVDKSVLEAHVSIQPVGKPEVFHIDGDLSNNNVDNLRWATRQEANRQSR